MITRSIQVTCEARRVDEVGVGAVVVEYHPRRAARRVQTLGGEIVAALHGDLPRLFHQQMVHLAPHIAHSFALLLEGLGQHQQDVRLVARLSRHPPPLALATLKIESGGIWKDGGRFAATALPGTK
ncbi:unnamed protein product [Phytophthora fragariaefolia]|uniref:Unnamed protein product n=1 Tax=Phytophthora fragariaefolia TaxID=1490495 RepID=A0A9W6X178_9STRA|nr:unnamed protein product [Phytophthora fragariaefolia]